MMKVTIILGENIGTKVAILQLRLLRYKLQKALTQLMRKQ